MAAVNYMSWSVDALLARFDEVDVACRVKHGDIETQRGTMMEAVAVGLWRRAERERRLVVEALEAAGEYV